MNTSELALAFEIAEDIRDALKGIGQSLAYICNTINDNACETCGSLARDTTGQIIHTDEDCTK